jgi:histidinol-phosphate aminotransferase
MSPSRRAFLRALGAGSLCLAGDTVPVLAAAAAQHAPGVTPIRLHSNENSHGPGAAALTAIQRSLTESNRYAFEALGRLQSAVAGHVRVSPRDVVTACGSSDLLDAAVSAFTSPGRGLVTVSPTFEAPGERAAAAGAPVVSVPVDAAGRLDLDGMLAHADGAGLIYLCNPNNPTSTVHTASDVRAFVERVGARAPDAIVLVDEAYHEYVDHPGYASAVPLAVASPSVVVTRTFSKIHGMAGLRVGYAVGHPATLGRMRPWLSTFGLSSPAIQAATASMADTAHVAAQRALNRDARRFTVEALARAGCSAFASDANFVMVDVGRDCRQFAAACAGRGIRIARAFPPLLQHARITIGTMDEMRKATAVFAEVLDAPTSARWLPTGEQDRDGAC